MYYCSTFLICQSVHGGECGGERLAVSVSFVFTEIFSYKLGDFTRQVILNYPLEYVLCYVFKLHTKMSVQRLKEQKTDYRTARG